MAGQELCCSAHSIAIFEPGQGHRSTEGALRWYRFGMSNRTSSALPGNPLPTRGFLNLEPGQLVFGARFRAAFSLRPENRYTDKPMTNPPPPNVKLVNTSDYRENYANSVQIRVNVWDFFLVFGTLLQQSETQVEIQNFQGVYLSPQQAKALLGILQQNVAGYESAFGEIKLDPRMMPTGPVH